MTTIIDYRNKLILTILV